jgi:peptidoglycan/xylan/chitin deacetylase (PgdA/CDA1 family)
LILLYHHVAPLDSIPAGGSDGWRFTHSPAAFERQLLELRRRHYRFISLAELVNELNHGKQERQDSVVVTFDDGWMDNYEFAFPVLQKLGITATFFVISEHVRQGASDAKRMGLAELKHLVQEGFTIGTHTRTHPDLTRIAPEAAREEIAGCKADVEQATGVPVEFFAYPGGAFNRNVAQLTREAGYKAACCILGPKRNDASSLFWLHRDFLSPGLNTLGDYYRLSPIARKLLAFRVNRRLKEKLKIRPLTSDLWSLTSAFYFPNFCFLRWSRSLFSCPPPPTIA